MFHLIKTPKPLYRTVHLSKGKIKLEITCLNIISQLIKLGSVSITADAVHFHKKGRMAVQMCPVVFIAPSQLSPTKSHAVPAECLWHVHTHTHVQATAHTSLAFSVCALE